MTELNKEESNKHPVAFGYVSWVTHFFRKDSTYVHTKVNLSVCQIKLPMYSDEKTKSGLKWNRDWQRQMWQILAHVPSSLCPYCWRVEVTFTWTLWQGHATLCWTEPETQKTLFIPSSTLCSLWPMSHHILELNVASAKHWNCYVLQKKKSLFKYEWLLLLPWLSMISQIQTLPTIIKLSQCSWFSAEIYLFWTQYCLVIY